MISTLGEESLVSKEILRTKRHTKGPYANGKKKPVKSNSSIAYIEPFRFVCFVASRTS